MTATLTWPLLPMRPAPGQTLTPANVVKLVRQIEVAGWLKLKW